MVRPPWRADASDEFIAWRWSQPEGRGIELFAGRWSDGAGAERAPPGQVPCRAATAGSGRADGGLHVFPTGWRRDRYDNGPMSRTALVRCARRLSSDAVKLSDPVIVVRC